MNKRFEKERNHLNRDKFLAIFTPSTTQLLIFYFMYMDNGMPIPLGILFSVGNIGWYFWLKRKLAIRNEALSLYVNSLEQKDFSNALYYGRVYYSIKNKGFKGVTGDATTIYDEQVINNDINAYK